MNEDERAARYSDLFASGHNHADNCALCPICATIGVLRNTKPEVIEHLAVAAREMIAVAGILLEEAGEALGGTETGIKPQADSDEEDGPTKIRRIDVS